MRILEKEKQIIFLPKTLVPSIYNWLNYVITGGFGSGKTYHIFIRAIALAVTHALENPKARNSSSLIIAPNARMVADIFVHAIEDVVRMHEGLHWHWLSKESKIIVISGWGFNHHIYLRSGEAVRNISGINGFVGYPFIFLALDETVYMSKEFITQFNLVKSRLMRKTKKGCYQLSTNPPAPVYPGNPYWIYKNLEENNTALLEVSTYENTALADTKAYAQKLIDLYGQRLATAFVYGKRLDTIGGRLIYSFREKRDVISQTELPFNANTIRKLTLSIDFNENPAVAMLSTMASGTIYCFKFFRYYECGIRELTKNIIAGYLRNFKGEIEVDGDPAGMHTRSEVEPTGKTDKLLRPKFHVVMRELEIAGLNARLVVQSSHPSIQTSAECVNILLEKGLLKIVRDGSRDESRAIQDMVDAPLVSDNYDAWKASDKEGSHYLDLIRYLANRLYPIKQLDYKIRQRRYEGSYEGGYEYASV